ncbi:hypothetical protein M569_13335, partial [Genlisea aurea]
LGLGINYGQIANNLPAPSRVVFLLGSLNITRVKLYDADPVVLSAFSYTDVEFIIGLGNEYLQAMTDPVQARAWIQQKVKPYIPDTKITCIAVGNEVLTGNDTKLMPLLLPAMQTIHGVLDDLGLSQQIRVTTAHSFGVLQNSFPPSAGTFRNDLSEYMDSVLDFHARSGSPFLINAYPFFAYKDNPGEISLSYALFEPNNGTTDAATGLRYDNMLYAQIDAVYSAIRASGRGDAIRVQVSETGWPSKGDADEPGATVENAELYNGNLIRRIERNEGTPGRPGEAVEVYVFALFNEDLKPGPVSERNYGLFYPNGTPVYDAGLRAFLPGMMAYSSSTETVSSRKRCFLSFILLLLLF